MFRITSKDVIIGIYYLIIAVVMIVEKIMSRAIYEDKKIRDFVRCQYFVRSTKRS